MSVIRRIISDLSLVEPRPSLMGVCFVLGLFFAAANLAMVVGGV